MAKARSRPRPLLAHSTTGRPRPRRLGLLLRRTLHFVIRPEALGAVLIVIAAAALSWLVPFAQTLPALRDDLVAFLGLHIFTVVGLVMFIGWLLIRHQLTATLRLWQRWLGWSLAALALAGVLALWRPDWQVGSVSLRTVTAGGGLGESFIASPGGILVWLVVALSAGFLLAPQAMLTGLRYLPVIVRTVWNWHLPTRTVRLIKAVVLHFFPNEPPQTRSSIVSVESAAWARTSVAAPDPALADDVAAPGETAWSTPQEEVRVTNERKGTLTRAATGPQTASKSDQWHLPPLDILKPGLEPGTGQPDNAARARLIEETLASFGVAAKVVQINEGPTVTQFGLEPGWEIKTRTVIERDRDGKPVLDKDGNPRTRTEEVSRTRVRVNQITALANDLALALAAPSIRIEAPVPGRPVVGLEVPNHIAAVVTLRSVIESSAFQRTLARSKLALALGQSVSGEAVAADLAKAPHLLIAGATGSGKSACINSIITCLLMHASPDEVRFVMIDPKRVELTPFADIPHLVFSEIIVDVDKVVGTLQAVIQEMESRYRLFAAMAVRNIDAYNRHPKVTRALPYWVVIIDELADLMMAAPVEVEKQICRLAQLARATGIHLIIATQRPSVDVVTGLIKANFPTRIAFAMTSQVDSRTILDTTGAEKLLGRGDMLYMPTDAAKPKRLQGAYVSDQEIERLVRFWKDQQLHGLSVERYDHLLEEAQSTGRAGDSDSDDPLLERARELALGHSRLSTSLLQRRLRIGYNRAARLIEQLEREGIVGPPEGSGSREVLVMTASDLGPEA